MKKLILGLLAIIIVISCKKQEIKPENAKINNISCNFTYGEAFEGYYLCDTNSTTINNDTIITGGRIYYEYLSYGHPAGSSINSPDTLIYKLVGVNFNLNILDSISRKNVAHSLCESFPLVILKTNTNKSITFYKQ